MAKGRHSRMLSRRSSTFTLVLAMLLMLSFVLLMLLALGILSLPVNTNDAPKANDLSSVMRHTQEKFDGLGERGEQWTEILSWEPRAFLYHNFLPLLRVPRPWASKNPMGLARAHRLAAGKFQ